jgi:hypothetical protein
MHGHVNVHCIQLYSPTRPSLCKHNKEIIKTPNSDTFRLISSSRLQAVTLSHPESQPEDVVLDWKIVYSLLILKLYSVQGFDPARCVVWANGHNEDENYLMFVFWPPLRCSAALLSMLFNDAVDWARSTLQHGSCPCPWLGDAISTRGPQ